MKYSQKNRLNKLWSILLCFCMVLSCVPTTVFAVDTDTSVSCATDGCEGTYENGFCSVDGTHYQAATKNGDGVYEIANAGQLYWFAGLVNGTLSDVRMDYEADGKLTADITVNPGSFDGEGNYIPQGTETLREWPGIGNNTYRGTFDGNQKLVSGLCYKADSAGDVGMFRVLSNGTIKNLTVKNSYFSGNTGVGAIVGYNQGTIENSKSEACTVKSANDDIGGIAGKNVGTISGCTNSSTVTGNGYRVGGITGTNGYAVYDGTGVASKKGTVENCENTGSISGGSYVGGVVGLNNFELKNCHNKNGSVTGTKNSVGGVTGVNSTTGVISDCTNTGTVAATGTGGYGMYVGGVAGSNGNSVTGSSNSGSVSGYKNVGGVVGENNSGAVANCENSGAVTGTDDNTGGVVGNNSATVKNSKNTENGKVKGNYYVGGVVGNNSVSDSTDLNGSFNEAAVEGYYCVGGVVGTTYTAVGNCHNTGNVTSTGNYAGGVVGQAQATVSGCYNTGDINCDGNYAGGVAGLAQNEITKCYNTGDVTGKGKDVGGIAGDTSANITKCYNTGDITGVGESSYNVGGIAGYSSGITSDCYSTGAVSGGYSVGAVIGARSDSESAINNYYLENSAKTNSGTAQYGIGSAFEDRNVPDVAGQTTVKTADAFKSGEVAYLLNGSTSEGTDEAPLVWFQTCGEGTPAFSGKTVYANSACDGSATYANAVSTDTKHVYKNGICACGEYEAATKNSDGVYEIANAGQLYWFAGLVNGTLDGVSQDSKANGKLVADITVNPGTFDTNGNYTPAETEAAGTTPRAWTPIGKSSADAYTGKFDGKKSDTENYTISGLYFNDTTGTYVGLFGNVGNFGNDGSVQNVSVKNSYFKAKSYVGGIVGNSLGTVTNCYNEATVVNTVSYAGGIVGNNHLGTIKNSKNAGVIKSGGDSVKYIGGITGNNSDGVTEKCENVASVSGRLYVGGIVGANGSGKIKNCSNIGTVTGLNTVGGIAGINYSDGQIIDCYNNNTVTGTGTSGTSIGAIVGNNAGDNKTDGTVTNCYYLKGCAKNNNIEQNGIGTNQTVKEDVAGQTIVKTADAFKSGEVAYLLNGGKTDGTQVWYQTCGEGTPAFSGKTVYSGYAQCKDVLTYANSELLDAPHEYGDDGICKNCKANEPAVLKDGYYEIDNLGKLLWFANYVNTVSNTASAKLTADIDATSVSYIGIGKDADHTFAGTFDGNNKTLKIALVSTEQYIAPFPHIGGATIKNLTVSGTIKTTHKFAAGIVGRVESGNATLENCLSLVEIDSKDYSGDGTHGGLISVAGEGSATTVNNCGFAGSIIGEKTTTCGGIVGWAAATVTIGNSYVAAKFTLQSDSSGDTFARNQKYVTVTNCYYLNALSDAICDGATQATDEQFKFGEVAYKLNGDSSTGVWKQTIGEDAYPNFTSTESVYSYTNCVDAEAYTNDSTTESGSHDYNDNGICRFDDTHYQPAVLNDDVYEIGNLGQLMWFAAKVNSQEITSHKAKLTADITIDNSVVWTSISLKDSCASSFEGDYHTITFANTREGSKFGLFGSYNYSTISNLYLKGSITCNQSDLLGALVNSGYRTTVNNVISTVSITNSGNASTGGLFGRLGGKNTQAMIQNCAVYADIKSNGRAGGLVGENWGGTQFCYIRYSAYMGDVSGSTAGAIMGYNGLQSKLKSYFTCVYYCEKDGLELCGGTYGGTISQTNVAAVTQSQFETGEVTYLLNSSSSTGVWKQTLGTDTVPNFTGGTVYKGYNQCDETLRYSNSPLRSAAHDYDADGFCEAIEGETHYLPATLNNNGTADDTTDDYYEISKPGQLFWFAEFVNKGGDNVKAKGVLTADIDLKEREFTPIGLYSDDSAISKNNAAFSGTFDGKYHVIYNLNVNMTQNHEAGLFSRVSGGSTLKNFGIVNATVKQNGTGNDAKGIRSGIVAGEIYRATVENVFTAGELVLETKHDQAGGLAGECKESTLTNCYTTFATLTDGRTGNTPTSATNCYYMAAAVNSDSAGTNATESQVKSGELTYKLNGKKSTDDVVWKQTLDGTNFPTFSGDTVYAGYNYCTDTELGYDNTAFASVDPIEHDYDADGFCTKKAGETHYQPCEGEGTTEKPYLIDNAGKLYWFAAKVNSGSNSINGKLTADITVNKGKFDADGNYTVDGASATPRDWTPIGDNENKYDGTFDGNGKYISGLYVNSTDNCNGIGLFGCVGPNGAVKTVAVKDSYIKGSSNVGGVAGANSGLITNCTSSGIVTGDDWYVGGVAGINSATGEITNCSNSGTVSGSSSVGGVAGYNGKTMTNCFNSGTVTGSEYIGGVVGYSFEATITNCYNSGSVTGSTDVGGVVGYNGSTITNCYYLDTCASSGIGSGNSGEAIAKTSDEFKSGEVTYLLNGKKSTDDAAWKQTLGEDGDDYPNFTGEIVYYGYLSCKEGTSIEYTNNKDASPTTPEHSYDNGFCKVCDVYEPCEGAGTTANPYRIKNAGNLYWFAAQVNSGSRSINGKLTADITVNKGKFDADGNYTVDGVSATPRDWTPIGNINKPYNGTFDGTKYDESGKNAIGNYTISGLYVNGEESYVGLFGYVWGTVKNVTVKNSYIKGEEYVGGVAGRSSGTITNCSNSATISGTDDYVGGVAGCSSGTITNCSNSATVNGTGNYVGGVAGNNWSTGKITNCSNSGAVNGSSFVGGVAGLDSSSCEITNCYNSGTVSGRSYVGGVIGLVYGKITNCYNTGTVSGSIVGGMAGNNKGNVTNCYNTGTVSGSIVGGVAGNNDANITNSYNSGTVSGSSFVGGVVAYGSGEVTNCYYLGTSETDSYDGTTYKTEKQFTSGEVTYLLNGKRSEGTDENPLVWKQTLNGTNFPGFSGDIVYSGYEQCKETRVYTNDSDKASTLVTAPHDYDSNGFCTKTEGECHYQPAELNNNKTPNDTSDDYYEIKNAGNLYWFAAQVNSGNTSINAKVMADITVNKDVLKADGSLNTGDFRAWTPIGSESNPYTGTFDGTKYDESGENAGGNYTISGLYVNGTENYIGLFGAVDNGGVKNVTVKDSYFKGNIIVGGVVGKNTANITNCSNYGTVIGTSSYVGGVVGNNAGTITNCSNYGAVSRIITADDDPEAGISAVIGGVVGNNTGTIKNSSNSGTVSGTYDTAGGVVGMNAGTITNCSNSGAVTGSSAVGGVVGSNTGTIKNSSNSGTVSATQSQIGGVAGYHGGSGKLINCYNTGAVTGSSTYACFVGGVAGFIISGELTNCYNTGTVSDGSYLGSVVGSDNNGTITNCYYLGTSETDNYDGTTYKTEAQFTSGEVTWLLNGKRSEGTDENPLVWKQTLGTDASPKFSGDIVYGGYIKCDGTGKFSNNTADVTDTKQDIPAHNYNNGFCTVCGVYQPCAGTGTQADPYKIANAGNLYWFAEQVNSGNTSVYAKLTANIIINPGTFDKDGKYTAVNGETPRQWTPIGTNESNRYTGTFDGTKYDKDGKECGKYTISGMYYNGSNEVVGLFGEICSATIKNVGVVNCYINASFTSACAGGVVGGNVDGNVMGCYNTGIITSPGYVGGVVGYNCVGGNVTGCYNTGTVTGTGNYPVGGVVGFNDYSNVTNCYNTGTITGTGTSTTVGGAVGENVNSNVTNCSNSGAVTGSYFVGGVVGDNDSNITNCYNTGTVTGADYYVGGVAGRNLDGSRRNGTITNCYNIGTVTGTGCLVGGVTGENRGNITNCYYLTGCAKDGNATVQYGIGNETKGGTTADVTGVTTGKTDAQFTSGDVTYLLNGEKSTEDVVWKQTLGADEYPNFTGGIVYKYTDCQGKERFVNESMENGGHYYENGFCACGEYQPCAEVNGVYIIKNAGNLYWFAAQVNSGKTTINGKLVADITVNNNVLKADGSLNTGDFRAWTPIGNSSPEYAGTFDGTKYDKDGKECGNYTISGLYVKGSEAYVGLFGYVTGATIKNISVTDTYFETSGSAYVGGIVGSVDAWSNDTVISGCTTSGTFKTTINGNSDVNVYSGGIAGYVDIYNGNAVISDCTSSGNVTITAYGGDNANIYAFAGGLVGYVHAASTGTVKIEKCYNTGNAETTINGDYLYAYAGGLTGYVYAGSTGAVKIENCYNTGKVTATADGGYSNAYAGGLGAYISATSNGTLNIEKCYNTGKVTATANGSLVASTYSGGLASRVYGSAADNVALRYCYYLDTSAEGGIGSKSEVVSTENVASKTADEFASGEVAYLLQNANGSTLVWGQTTSKDGATPILTSNEEYRVIPVKSGGNIVNYSVLHMGETNGDGQVDIYDYQTVVNIALSDTNTKDFADKYDFNGDGVVDALDLSFASKSELSEEAYKDLRETASDFEGNCYIAKVDFDGDGVVDVLDIQTIEKLLSGNRVII